jgi:hypothetical protein
MTRGLKTDHWTLENKRWSGWGYCHCCNGMVDGGGDFCSFDCANTFYFFVPNHSDDRPRYNHICDACEYLGSFKDRKEQITYDLYFHTDPKPRSPIHYAVLAVYGKEPHEYLHGPLPEAFAYPEEHYKDSDDWYKIAICRAQQYGLL